jgi:hypothetical protein
VTPPARATFRTACAVAVILACLAALTWYFWPIHGVLFQIYALAALFVALRSTPPLDRWLRATPAAHRVVLYLLLGAVVAGHFSLKTRRYFPFVAWDIFASVSEQETVFCRELVGTTSTGRQVRLLIEQLFPSIVQFDLPPDRAPGALDRLVAAMAKQYNAHHPGDPVREVDLMLLAVKLHLPPGQTRSQPSCELLQRFDLSPEHSS